MRRRGGSPLGWGQQLGVESRRLTTTPIGRERGSQTTQQDSYGNKKNKRINEAKEPIMKPNNNN